MSEMAREFVDCLIVGGGPAGLTAATYLGRFRRSVLLIDAGESRLARIPLARNVPGFPNGVGGAELHARLKDQAHRYGARLVSGAVTALGRTKDHFEVQCDTGSILTRRVLLATGVNVTDPDIHDLPEAVRKGLIRYCPICDGFEAIGSRVAVLGGRPGSLEEARFLRTYVDDLTFVPAVEADPLSGEEIAMAAAAGIKLETRPCTSLALAGESVLMRFESGPSLSFDIVYPCLGTAPRSEFARELGAPITSDGELLTDKHHETGVPGLYAAGDVLRGLDQVASACGQAAIAATAMHNALRRFDETAHGLLASSGDLHDIDVDRELR